MMKETTITAHAKLNLYLHIVGKDSNRYHLLDSLVTFTKFGDRITFRPAEKFCLTITGPYKDELEKNGSIDDNLITRSIRLLEQRIKSPVSFHLTLEKNIPLGAGLGGGSSNAAATLKYLEKILNLDTDLTPITSKLGSDITACLNAPNPTIMHGTGNTISALSPIIPQCPVLLINPNKHCSTPSVYKNLNMSQFSSINEMPKRFKTIIDLSNFLNTHTHNDLSATAQKIEPDIKDCLNALRETEKNLVTRLSGSGATCFGLYETINDRDIAAQKIKKNHPDWWVISTETL